MFRFFHKNKLKFNEGQLAPFFIAILAILIILALVTINLGKVAFIRTESTNAVDSGAISAGSMMANIFNALASANAEMKKQRDIFFASVSVLYMLALLQLLTAYTAANAALAPATQANATALSAWGQACPSPCFAVGTITAAAGSLATAIAVISPAIPAITGFIDKTWGILVATIAFHFAQWYYFYVIRKNTREGREGAIGGGLSYAFSNSGLASKLKEGEPPDELHGLPPTDLQKRNYRDEFDLWMEAELEKDVDEGETYDPPYNYDWEDGQARLHNVEVDVSIGDVETYELRVAVLPIFAEIFLLNSSLTDASMALASLEVALSSYSGASSLYLAAASLLDLVCWLRGYCGCCSWANPWCCSACALSWSLCVTAASLISAGMGLNTTGITTNTTAVTLMTPIFVMMTTALLGLLPGDVILSDDDWDPSEMVWIPCWIDDIIHDRLVRVDITQQHQGADLGLWQTRYPDIHSYSKVDFRGTGQIYEPKLEHDASIIETD